MNKVLVIFLTACMFISVRCSERGDVNKFWIKFVDKMNSNDFEYLINNSLDTIMCSDCSIDKLSENEMYSSNLIFKQYIKCLIHIDLLKHNYSIYKTDNEIIVIYNIKPTISFEGGYDLIYKFVKKDDKYKFFGMILTP